MKLPTMQNQRSLRLHHEIDHFSNLEHVWWGAKTAAGQRRYDNKASKLKETCDPKKSAKILEIGCGDGEFTKRLVKFDYKITATDITSKLIKKAKRRIKKKNVKFIVDNAERMMFKDNTFDLVCGISILHHVDIEKALKETYRVLKPGGQLFFTEPNLFNPHIFLGLHISWMREKMEFSPDETALVRFRVQKLLKSIGFKKVNVHNYDFLHPKTPSFLIPTIERVSQILEKIPLIKEISGSLIIWAVK